MDPLSITASILALIGVLSKASKTFAKIRRMRDAPAIIQALNNEVSDLRLMLLDANDHLEGQESTTIKEAVSELCRSALSRARSKAQEVDMLLHYQILKPGREREFEIDKSAFFRKYEEISKLHADLREARQRLMGLFIQLGKAQNARIEVSLTEIHSSIFPQILRNQTNIQRSVDRIEYLQNAANTPTQCPRHEGPPPSAEARDSSGIAIFVSKRLAGALHHQCICPAIQKRVALELHPLLGSLFLGYAAAPKAKHGRTCPVHQKASLWLQYFFPWWYAIRLETLFGTGGGTISCSLAIEQVIPPEHEVFDMIELNDVVGIRKLVVSGQLSVDAQIQYPHCGTPLYHAVMMGSTSSAKALLELGANRSSVYAAKLSPEKAAWCRIFSKSWSPNCRESMKNLFPHADFDEIFEFDLLHKATLSLLGGYTVEAAIRAQPSHIDSIDHMGRTALTWAAARGDFEATRTLLENGADCNIMDVLGKTPLSYAVRRSIECTEILLQANADPNTRTGPFNDTLLHQVAHGVSQNNQSMQLMELLIGTGSDVNAVNVYNETALLQTSRTDIAKYLLEHGADPDIHSAAGVNALSRATMRNNHALIRFLLRERHDHTRALKTYDTFMHLTAQFADAETLRLLARGGLRPRDTGVKNGAGLTPFQLAFRRRDVDADWRDAFSDFLSSIDKDRVREGSRSQQVPRATTEASGVVSSSDSDSEETDREFEDAVEFLPATG